MKLFLAVAVLMLALAALTEAQDSSVDDLGTQIKEAATNFADQVKTAYDKVHNSEFAVNVRTKATELSNQFWDWVRQQ